MRPSLILIMNTFKSIFGGGQSAPPPPQPAPPPPTTNDAADRAAAAQEAGRVQRAQGRASTILTSGAGLLDPATVQKKTLLGS